MSEEKEHVSTLQQRRKVLRSEDVEKVSQFFSTVTEIGHAAVLVGTTCQKFHKIVVTWTTVSQLGK